MSAALLTKTSQRYNINDRYETKQVKTSAAFKIKHIKISVLSEIVVDGYLDYVIKDF